MQVFIRRDPKWGKYAVYADGSRAHMPESEVDEKTLQMLKDIERREHLDRLRRVAPRLFL